MKRILIILTSCVLITSFVVVTKSCKGNDAIKVYAEKVSKRNITEIVSASGKIQPEKEVKISSDVSGEIVEIYVKEGDKVSKGTLLCKINPDIYQSNVERVNASVNVSKAQLEGAKAQEMQAQANFENAKNTFERQKKLLEQNAISQQEYDAAKAQYESAKATLQNAKETISSAAFQVKSTEASAKEANSNLNKTNIYAPVDGVVSKLNKEKGERVVGTAQMDGTEIMRLANLSEMEVEIDVNENDILRVKKEDTADIEVDAFKKRKFKGIVTEVANSANNLVGNSIDQVTNYKVKIRVLQDSYKDLVKTDNSSPFRPGMSATVDIKTKRALSVISIPIMAVTAKEDTSETKKKNDENKEDGLQLTNNILDKADGKEVKEKKEYVFVVDNGVAKILNITTGIQDNTYIEVLSGLKGDETVVGGPYKAVNNKLKHKSKIEVVDKDKVFNEDNN
jgi:HlyD family secretion protein